MQTSPLEITPESSISIFKCAMIFLGLIFGFLIVASLWLNPHVNNEIYMDNKVSDLLNKYVQLGVDLNQPVACNSNAIETYNRARNIYVLIESYVPYTSQPKMYYGFLNSNKPMISQFPCEHSLQNKKSAEVGYGRRESVNQLKP